jgi:hypothetical protein
MSSTTDQPRTLYEEAPDEFVVPNKAGDPTAGGKIFKRDKDAPGVAYYTELTREDLLRPGRATKGDRKVPRK